MEVRVRCSPGSRLDFSFGPGDELAMIELRPPTQHQGQETSCRSVFKCTELPDNYKIVAARVAPLALRLTQAVETQQGVKEALRDFVLEVRRQLLEPRPQVGQDGQEELESFRVEALFWGLLEVIYLWVGNEGGFIVPELAAWLGEHNDTLYEVMNLGPTLPERIERLQNRHRPDLADDYWPCLRHLVFLGRTQEALDLLLKHDVLQYASVHSAPQGLEHNTYQLLDKLVILLRSQPGVRPLYQSVSLEQVTQAPGLECPNMSEYCAYHEDFKAQCKRLLQDRALFSAAEQHNPATARGVRSVLELLTGKHPSAVREQSKHSLEAIVALGLREFPNSQFGPHMGVLVNEALEQSRPEAHQLQEQSIVKSCVDLLLAAAERETQQVIQILTESDAFSPMFMTFACQLISVSRFLSEADMASRGFRHEHSDLNPIGRPVPLLGCDQTEFWRLLAAQSLMAPSRQAAQSPCWQWALAYLAQCPVNGRPAAESLLESLPVGSSGAPTDLASDVISAARELGLSSTAASVARSAGARAWYSGQVATAAGLLGSAGVEDGGVRIGVVLEPAVAETVQPLHSLPATDLHTMELTSNSDLQQLVQQTLDTGRSPLGPSTSDWLLHYLKVQDVLDRTYAYASGAEADLGTQKSLLQELVEAVVQLLTGDGRSAASWQAPVVPDNLLLPLLGRLVPALQLPGLAAVCNRQQLAVISSAVTRAVAAAQRLPKSQAAATEPALKTVQQCLVQLAANSFISGAA